MIFQRNKRSNVRKVEFKDVSFAVLVAEPLLFVHMAKEKPVHRVTSIICGEVSCIAPSHLTYEPQSAVKARRECFKNPAKECNCAPNCLRSSVTTVELVVESKEPEFEAKDDLKMSVHHDSEGAEINVCFD